MPKMRSAFTMMEMLLVLALIVVIGGISYPSFQGMLDEQRLTAAEDMIRGECAGPVASHQRRHSLPLRLRLRHGPLADCPRQRRILERGRKFFFQD